MRHRGTVLLLLWALSTSATLGKNGKPIDPYDPSLPPTVVSRFKSVFQIIFVVPENGSFATAFEMKDILSNVAGTAWIKIWEDESKQCDEKKKSFCRLSGGVTGTGVLVSSSHELWTAGHVVVGSVFDAQGRIPRLIIADQIGGIVWDSTMKNHRFDISYLGSPKAVQETLFPKADLDIVRNYSDFAILDLTPGLNQPPVPLGSKKAEVGKAVYVAGFASDKAKHGGTKPTSWLHVSTGRILRPEEFFEPKKDPKNASMKLKYLGDEQQIFATSALSMPGASGGAALNDQGELIGILTLGRRQGVGTSNKNQREGTLFLDAAKWIPSLIKKVPSFKFSQPLNKKSKR